MYIKNIIPAWYVSPSLLHWRHQGAVILPMILMATSSMVTSIGHRVTLAMHWKGKKMAIEDVVMLTATWVTGVNHQEKQGRDGGPEAIEPVLQDQQCRER